MPGGARLRVTIAIARRFGERILIAADTTITDAVRQDILPGRLKAIVLSPTVSVAYAGHADPALHAVREARRQLQITGRPDRARATLEAAARRPDIDVEFIWATHAGGQASLRKIGRAGATDELDACFIGDSAVVKDVREVELLQRADPVPDYGITADELRFWGAFTRLYGDRGVQIRAGVGGLPICLLASPLGHTYQGVTGASVWDPLDLSVGLTPGQIAARKTGETAWNYAVISSRWRGVAVIGAAFEQLALGYVYSPLEDDAPELLRLPNATPADDLLRVVAERVEVRARRLGGGILEGSSLPT
jgi:hypothetical protein